jgi:hypothetical protein
MLYSRDEAIITNHGVLAMRINARLDEEDAKTLLFLKGATGQSTTEIVKHSLKLYLNHLQEDAYTKNQILLKELAGIGEGPEDLSENYKDYLTESLSEKYDID